MGGIPDRKLLIQTVGVSSVAFAAAVVFQDWLTALLSLPIFVTVSYWSLRVSRWLSRRVNPQPQGSELSAAEPTAPSSDRPEHARRRRGRRRQRGRR